MGLIAFLIVGGIAGWLASTFMNKSQGILMNIVVGIVAPISVASWAARSV